jgi:radical SAM superfamily enzyme YgiQ (UPF0313 family)
MKILFVNPKFNYRGKDKFPIGLAYLMAVAKSFGKVFVIDENVGDCAEEKIMKMKPDFLCITSTTPSFSRAIEIVKFAKENTSAKVIFGGTHATFKPEDALAYGDIVVRGEGEETIKEILEGKNLHSIDGISFKEGEKIIHNKDRELIENLDALPFPAYELFDLKKYEMLSIITSRGCTYNCAYCCATHFWKCKVRFRSVENVLAELELISKLGFKKLKIHDSTFTLDKERAKRICKGIIERKLDFSWSCETRADFLDEELLKLMKRAGCSLICMGLDSASEEVLRKNKRFVNLELTKKIFKLAKEIGIRTRAYVVFGLEGETEESVKETLKFLHEIKPDQIMLSLATAYPGTELEKGRIIEFEQSWVKKFEGHGEGAKLYLPNTLTVKEYKRLADYMYEEIKKLKKEILKERVVRYGRSNFSTT